MTSEQRRQESEAYWFRSPAARNVLEDFMPSREDEATILDKGGPEPEPIPLTPTTNLEDVVRNEPEAVEAEPEMQNPLFFSDTDRTRLQGKLKEQGLDRIKAADPFPQAPRGLGGEAGAGFARGIDQTQAMGFGLLGLMGEALEVEGLSDLGVEGYKRNMEEAAKNMASVQDPFEEIGGVGDAALYATGVLSEQLPQLMLSLLGGGIGGFAAKTVAKKVIANEIGKRVAAGMAKDEAEKVVAKMVAQRALQGFDVPVVRGGVERVASGIGQEAMQQATRAGALGGAYVANVGQIAGGSFGEIEQETGLRDPVNALGFALLGGALETGAEALMFAPVANKLIGRGVENAATGMAIGPRTQTALRLAATPPTEGLTEYGQTFTEQAAVASADPNRTLAEVAGTPEAERERQIAAAAGVVAGGGFAAASQAASYLIPETSRAVQRKLQQAPAPQEEPQQSVLTGDWSQPVQVDDVTMQRNSTGLWAVVNPNENLLQGFPRLQTEDGNSLLVVTPEADEEGRAAFLVARAEKALSDISEGELTTEPPAEEDIAVDTEDELGEPVELDEETEATRLRQSPVGATALREQLAEQEEVSAALAEPAPVTEQPAQPIKSAEESAQVIDSELTELEKIRRGEDAAFLTQDQMRRQEYAAAGAMQPGGTFSERLGRIKESQIGGDQEKVILQNFYNQRRKELETAKEEERKQRDEDLARPLTRAAAFVDGLELNQRVGLVGYEGRGALFMGRRKNGNAVFRIGKASPVSEGLVGEVAQIELKPSQFNRVTLAPRPEVTKTPLEQAFDDALGPNPTKQQAERVLGSPYTGTRGAQKSTFSDGLGSEAFPIEISWFNKKGDKGTIIPSIRGTFTNSPFTTVRQMNQGLEVVVPDNQLGSLSKDIQVEAVSDKKGGRKNIVTGVNLWGRTYRRSLRSPKDFSVDIPLTKRGAGARKQGLLLFDNIYKNSPERIARSEAAVRGAKERQTPPEQMLREWELVQAGLNPVEYAFYEDALGRATDFINRSNLPENVKDEARFEAQNNIVKAFAKRKKRRGKQPAEGTATLAKTYLEELAKLRDGRLEKTRERSTRLIGNVERNRERMSDLELERGSIDPQRAAEIEERVIDEAMKSNEVDLDRAVEATLKRLAAEQPNRKAREVFNTRASLRAIAGSYKNIGKFNPIYTAMNAVRTADRSIRRREMNEQTELITDREARELAGRQQRTQDPATTQEFAESEIDLAQRAETMQSADRVELPQTPQAEAVDAPAPEADPDAPMTEDYESARERLFSLSDADRDLILRFERQLLDERGRPVRGQKSNLTQAQKRRARLIKRYLIEGGADLESQINADQPRAGRGQTVPAATNLSGRSAARRNLSGANASVARGRPATAPQGRPESVGRPDRTGAGTVQGAGVRGDGGSGVRASLAPQTVRQLSRAAKSRFVQSFGRLTDAEASALTEAEIDRAYEAIVTRKNAATVRANRVVSGETPRSLADLGSMSGSELLAGAVDAMRAYEADRARVQAVRDNVGALLRARAFADVSTFLGSVAGSNAPQDVKLRAREFSKLLGRGVDLNAVGVQIGRFGDDTSWAGLFTRDSGNSYNIALNLDAQHDRDSAINTMLHELSHVVTSKKIRGEVRLNNVERNAIDRLEALRREAVVAAARDLGLDVPANLTDSDYERLSNDLDQRSLPQNDPDGNNRVYASLTNLEEFTVEVSSNPELAGLMARLGFGQARGRVTLLNAIRDAWNALVELVTGVKADPNSPLAKAFKDSWILNYSNAGGEMNLGDYTMPEIRRSAINRELARRQGIEDEINREVEARNLAGTTAEREAILNEMFEPSVTASAARVQRAANRLSQADFVQWARKNGYNFVDPVAVYNNNRTSGQAAPEQATGDTVQVAESRAARGDLIRSIPIIRSKDDARAAIDRAVNEGNIDARNAEAMKNALDMLPNAAYSNIRLLIRNRNRLSRDERAVLDMSRMEAFLTSGMVSELMQPSQKESEVLEANPSTRPFEIDSFRRSNERSPTIMFISGVPTASTPAEVFIHENGHIILDQILTDAERKQARAIYESIKGPSRHAVHILNYAGQDKDTLFSEWFAESLVDYHRNRTSMGRSRVALNSYDKLLANIYKKIVDFFTNEKQQIDAFFDGFYEAITRQENAREEASQRNVQVAESRAVGRRPYGITTNTYNGKTYTRPGLIAGENADLDPRAQELVAKLKQFRKASEQFANLKARELNNLIRKFYKGGEVPTNLINDALGNLDNPLTEEQFEEVRRLELTDPETAAAKRVAYLGENRERFRRERQAPALLALPEELAGFLREIGDDLKALQQQALDLGIPKGDMAVAFTENLGIYLTRSYNAFLDQAKWEEALRLEDRELGEQSRMGQMRNHIRDIRVAELADKLMSEAMEAGRPISRAEAERRAAEGTTTEEVDQILENYIAYTKQEPSSESFSGLRLPGRQNIKSLEKRKQLSDALREFYGQVENPAINFVTSYAKISSLLANHQFQSDLKKLGLKEGWLWDPEAQGNIGQRPPAGYERIAADNDKSLSVLAGLFANSDLVRGLRETFPPNSLEAGQWWLHPFMKLTGFSMGLKTVGSIASQIRNYWGSYAVPIAGGNMTFADFFRPEWRKNLKEAHQISIASVFRNYGNDRKKMIDDIKELYELGVMGESLTVGLLNDLTRLGKDAAINDEQFFNTFEKILKKPGRRVWDATKGVWKKAEQVYGMTDDIFKVFTYLSELDKYRKVYPNKSDAELKQTAATIARDIHWTYSKAPAIVSELKKFPFIAPFVTFTTETIRITLNIGKLAKKEIDQGRALIDQGTRENNAELVRQGRELQSIGWKRVRGMGAIAVGPWAIGFMAMSAAGLSGDDLEDLRQFLPDWQKNSQIFILGRNGSEVNYVDVSYLDPFEVWKKPTTAFFRGLGRADNFEEFFTEAVVGAAIEAASPFTSEQILAGAIMDVMRNRDANGRQVYNPQDSADAISFAVGKQLAAAFTPGTVDTGMRVGKALTDQISETGRDYNLANELFGVPLGSRVSAVDASQALGFKASQFLRARRDARSIFNREFLSRGSRSESDVISAYQRSNTGLRDVTEQLRKEYLAAINLGVSPAKARSILRAAGLDRDSARMVSTGIYRRLTPSEEQDRMAAPERKRAARQAIAETPQREVLFP